MASDYSFPCINDTRIAVLGLGYVGLPLAVEFARKCLLNQRTIQNDISIIAFDIDKKRIDQLQKGLDITGEIDGNQLKSLNNILFTFCEDDLAKADIFIVTVPTPIDHAKKPDVRALQSASETVGKALNLRNRLNDKSDAKQIIPFVVYESTVYPGATEEICQPLLEKFSKMKSWHPLQNQNSFVLAYSPERINPGDKTKKLKDIIKIVGSNYKLSTKWLSEFYGRIIEAGIHPVSSIKIGEAAKVIENTQRDLNIALINELSIIFSRIGINTYEVLEAAETKWNFLPFKPGLVGGHCIGVDPYYLTYKSQTVGYHPEVVLAGRRINDSMGEWIGNKVIYEMVSKSQVIPDSKILILGFTFKEDCPDIRNTKVTDICSVLRKWKTNVYLYDPVADLSQLDYENGINPLNRIDISVSYDAVIVAVAHKQFKQKSREFWLKIVKPGGVIFDVKSILPKSVGALTL